VTATTWVVGRAYWNDAEGMAWLRLHGCWLTADGAVVDSSMADPAEMMPLGAVSP
jgi:hypothetical protein